jgi:hypothetical protein
MTASAKHDNGRFGNLWIAIASATILILQFRAAGQTPTQSSASIGFNRPEAWALKYFTAVTTFTGIGPPVVREPGSLDIGLELGWIPWLDANERRVGFEGTALEDLNKTPLLGRVRASVGLPGGISAELGWVPPIGINGEKANLFAAALERPFVDTGVFSAGLRIYGQVGHAKGDITCPKSVVSQAPGSAGNPLSCTEPSQDTATLNHVGGALTAGVRLGGGTALDVSAGATYNDVQFQVGSFTNGVPDNTSLTTHGWTGWVAAGGGCLVQRTWLGIEAFYSPLPVRRFPRTDLENDSLFNVRAVIRYRIR